MSDETEKKERPGEVIDMEKLKDAIRPPDIIDTEKVPQESPPTEPAR